MSIAEKETPDSPQPEPTPIGARLREIRQGKGLTIQQVADATGFALSFLSLLERDKVSINVDNLTRLARFYGVRMVSLFDNEPGEPVLHFTAASLAAKAATIGPGGAIFTLLADRRYRHLEPLHIVVGPGGGDPDFRSYEGESLMVVLEGSVEILDRKGARTLVEGGDFAFFDGREPRRIINASMDARAALVIATSPPNDRRDRIVDGDERLIIQSEDS